jgi:hypothetical protein
MPDLVTISAMVCPVAVGGVGELVRVDDAGPAEGLALRSGGSAGAGGTLEAVGALHLGEQRDQDDDQLRDRVEGLEESALMGSARWRIPAPRAARSWIRFRVSRTVRPSRSRVWTTMTSPSRAYSITACPGAVGGGAGLLVDVVPLGRDPCRLERDDMPIEVVSSLTSGRRCPGCP